MKTYEDYSQSPDGWNVSCTLELEDDGKFSYSEGQTDYTNASLSGGAGGTWRRGDGVIILLAERVYPPMYFPWAVGQELIAKLRDGALDFGGGWTLRPPTPRQEYTIKTPLSNTGTGPLPLVLEPWGIRHTLAPGERAEVVARGRWWEGKPTVDTRDDEVAFDGRNGSWATVVPEPPPPTPPPKPKPPAPPRVPAAGAAKPDAQPRVTPPVWPPVVERPARPFEPRAPSPELAALLRRWVDELPTGGSGNMVDRLCIDHESFAQRAEPGENADIAYGKLEPGLKEHPELLELLPPDRGWPS